MFRFTIRDVLWLMVVVALGVVWWGERMNASRARDERDVLVRLLANVETPRWQLRPELMKVTLPVEQPPTPVPVYGSRWNGPYEMAEWDTNSLDGLK